VRRFVHELVHELAVKAEEELKRTTGIRSLSKFINDYQTTRRGVIQG
jgi:hypothetical protein